MSQQLFFIILFTVFATASGILTKSAFNKKSNLYAFTFFHNLAGSLAILPLVFFDNRLPTEIAPWILLCLGTLFSMLGDYYYFSSMNVEEVSVVTLVFRVRIVLVFLVGAIFYHEPLTASKIIGALLVTAGPLLIAYNRQRVRFSQGIIYAFISNIFLAALFVIDKRVSEQISVPLYNFVNFFSSSLFFLILYSKQKKGILTKLIPDSSVTVACVAGIFLSLASLSRRYSFQFGEISVATPLLNLSVITTILLGIILLKERDNIGKKLLGSALVIAGAVIIG